MSMTQTRMALIFNEWAERYSKNPDEFGEILNGDGSVISDYGESSAIYFKQIADDMDANNLLPK